MSAGFESDIFFGGAIQSRASTRKCVVEVLFYTFFPNIFLSYKIDATHKNPEVVRLLGFFIPIFHSANLVDANG